MTVYYELRRNYQTGNSFGSECIEDEQFGPVWKDLSLAKIAFDAVAMHYELYLKIDNYYRKYNCKRHTSTSYAETRMLLIMYRAAQPWFENASHKSGYIEFDYYSCSVLTDDNEYRSVDVGSHIGYFESLHSLQLVKVNERTHQVEEICQRSF